MVDLVTNHMPTHNKDQVVKTLYLPHMVKGTVYGDI
jgi:hypothetical protein